MRPARGAKRGRAPCPEAPASTELVETPPTGEDHTTHSTDAPALVDSLRARGKGVEHDCGAGPTPPPSRRKQSTMSVGTAKALGHTVTAGSKRQKKGGEAEEKRAEAEGTKKVRVAAERQEKAAEKRVAAATKRATADAAPLAAAAKRQKMEAEAEEKRAEAAAKRAEKARLAAERKAQAAEKRVAAAAKRATADAAKARRQEGRESKRQAKAQAAKAADEERVARAAAKAAREREKAARAEAAEEARRARQLPATSAEGGATSTAAKLYEKLARPTALALVKEDATNRPTLAPLLAVTATPTALAWCEELRNVFVGAYATASEYPKTQADEANLALRMLCFGSSVRAAMRRGFVAALHPEGVPAGLKVVVYELLRGMYETFKLALSTVAPPAPPPAVVEVDVEAGDVVTFVASWALSRELVKAVEAVCGRGGKEAAWGLPLLLRLVEPREDAVERVMDSGYMYIRSRELYGNLVYAKQRVRDAFSLVQAILEANLTVKHLRVHGPRAYQLAVDAVRAAPPVKAALHGLFADAPVPAGREVQHTKLCEALGAVRACPTLVRCWRLLSS